ncbi:MAG TPA: OsmC family peroxiredoxin [Gemmatimonadales bacterium]|nr:OsmC family peroxiredoxin [Gemmatimonadales bacterium]
MIKQQAQAIWRGGLKDGSGSFRAGTISGQYSFASRFEGGAGSTPEELIAASHASCFSMALSLFLEKQGHTAEAIQTTATVHLDPKELAITRIELDTEAEVPGLAEDGFQQLAEQARENCPVSKALEAVEIVLKSAKLTSVTANRA